MGDFKEANRNLIQAATLILLRNGSSGAVECLLLRRNQTLADFAGAWVFPGGKVAACDQDQTNDELEVAKIAAIRETQEETGVTLSKDHLLPFSHWTPPRMARRQFATWFFLAKVPTGQVRIDQQEIDAYQWMSPQQALNMHAKGDLLLIPPTYVSLFHLQAYQTPEQVIRAFETRIPDYYKTKLVEKEQQRMTLWQQDCAWQDLDIEKPGRRHRLITTSLPWTYIRQH
ncbi:MAG: NUDIX hydrolase [bacterium]